jgi:geranylgeranylglycerol-phosphate geranylgeranyltransferase
VKWGFARKVRAYLELVRIHNVAVSLVTTYTGYITASKLIAGGLEHGSELVAALAIVALIAGSGYVINDYYDVVSDSVSKPWRPIPSGRVSRREARILAYVLMGLGLIVSLLILKPNLILFVLSNAILVHEYSRWIKKTGFIGNITVALNSAATIVFGALAFASARGLDVPVLAFIPALYAFLLILGREVVKGIEDYEGDKLTNTRTLAVVWGPRRAAIASAVLLVAVIALSPLPYILAGYNTAYLVLAAVVDILILVSLAGILTGKDVHKIIDESRKARSYLKAATFVGGLAFILGVL